MIKEQHRLDGEVLESVYETADPCAVLRDATEVFGEPDEVEHGALMARYTWHLDEAVTLSLEVAGT